MDGIHDMGGMHGFGPVVPDGEAFHSDWERRLFGLNRVSRLAGITVGHFRAAIESMPPAEYLAAGYYERWMYGLQRRLEAAGTLAPEDVDAAMERVNGEPRLERSDPEFMTRCLEAQRSGSQMAAAAAPRFRPGQRVRVLRMRPPGHTRCPRYVRGALGVIERVHGDATLPDALARNEERPPEALYAVRFRSDDLFGPGDEPPFRVLVDLWESYLEEPADA
ncbi:MAG TPA: nitrile hydratase subunit beta [Gaiellales bacterium]|nr:nitrile hydratase subunit beta [Gaiellales bacterium]